jgi:hypothetical protein
MAVVTQVVELQYKATRKRKGIEERCGIGQ